ncbi:MAG TPA: CRISPR-associated helicase Cas3' [Gammaproteobacteria bacterium]|nr:CRISPR-associated helicase Cas3' [Gammaproteobacteria bacterium]
MVRAWLSLEHHCTDVAAVFRCLCGLPGPRRALNRAAGIELADAHLDRLSVFAFLHDIGKCNRGFQAKADPDAVRTAGHVRETGVFFSYDERLQQKLRAALDFQTIGPWFPKADEEGLRLLLASISHHGKPVEFQETETHLHRVFWADDGVRDPIADIAHLARAARAMFPGADATVPPMSATPALQHRFAGLVMLADWLGSHAESFFPFVHGNAPRAEFARSAAARALVAVGLDVGKTRRSTKAGMDFSSLFSFQPTPLQQALFENTDSPIVIAESDTGSGKTEAALGHFYRLFMEGKVDGLYFALPTRVAASELYERVLVFVRQAFGAAHPPVLLAVPGYAQMDGEPPEWLPEASRLWQENVQACRHERAWAAERPKRFLAAPVAVGTIDQALLSVMQVNHAHLRAVCLERSLLVVDEVHASDTYMRGILRALLHHHREAGGHALLLSATLGSAARSELLTHLDAVASVPDLPSSIAYPYPVMTDHSGEARPLPDAAVGGSKQVAIEPLACLADQVEVIGPLADAVASGARVLVILNTVARVIWLLRAAEEHPGLRAALFRCEGVICPHHGRFSRIDRQRLDKAVTQKLGKGGGDGPLLLIGSQTLEQSLDIDADWLVTDLCPMDVLLQRIGRLHRHQRVRPPEFEQARCTVLVPNTSTLTHLFDERGRVHPEAGLGSVYPDLRIAQLTREVIGEGVTVSIPEDNRRLVEAATHPANLDRFRDAPWERHRNELLALTVAHGQAARMTLIQETAEFGDDALRFHTFDERLVTRLGLEDRRISLPVPVRSPFGQRLDEVAIPGWMARGSDASDLDSPPTVTDEGLRFRYAGGSFRYTRFGLEREDECEPSGR